MKVHFIASRVSIEKDIDTLREIVRLVKVAGHTVVSEWIELSYSRQTAKKAEHPDWKEIYKINLEAVAQADVIIAETSYENFGVGFQVALATNQKKSILLLRHDEVDDSIFVSGVEKKGWVVHKEYNTATLPGILDEFLKNNDIPAKDMRFNFYTDRKTYNYLRLASLRTGKAKAAILRELVKREVERQETDF